MLILYCELYEGERFRFVEHGRLHMKVVGEGLRGYVDLESGIFTDIRSNDISNTIVYKE